MNPYVDADLELILTFQQGDESAFDVLYERHHLSTLNVAFRLLGSRDAAEDIAQEVFVKLYTSPKSYHPTAKFTTWLYSVTYNACIDEMRRSKNTGALPEGYDLCIPDTYISPEFAAESNELARVVQSAIASLPEKQRAAVVLQRYEGLTYQEIADVLKTSLPSVESLLFRAKESLKKRLASYVETTEVLQPQLLK